MRTAPSGYIFNRQLFDRIGRERHADAWTGTIEHTARRNLTSIEQYETDCITPGLNHSGSGMGGFVVRQWTPEMSEKHRAEIYSDVYQAERAARTRYDDVVAESLRRLECCLLKSAVLDTDTGRIHALAPQHWRTRRAEGDLAKGKGPISETRTGILLIAEMPVQEPTAPVRKSKQAKLPLSRKRGPPPLKRSRVKEAMRKFGLQEVQQWTEEARVAQFGASRSVCREALEELESEFVGD